MIRLSNIHHAKDPSESNRKNPWATPSYSQARYSVFGKNMRSTSEGVAEWQYNMNSELITPELTQKQFYTLS